MFTFRFMHYTYRYTLMALLLFSVFYAAAGISPDVIYSTGWEDCAGKKILVNVPEMELVGPLSFSVDKSGIFLFDAANNRLLKVSKDNKTTVFAENVAAWSIRADGNGGVFVQEGEQIGHYDQEGKQQSYKVNKSQDASHPLIEGYGNELLVAPSGYLTLRDVKQNTHPISGLERVTTPLGDSGKDSPLNLEYNVKRMSGNEARIIGLNSDGKVLASIRIVLDEGTPGAVLFKGLDDQGNIYTEVEILNGNDVGLEVHKYAPSGERLASYSLPNNYYTTVYKKTEISPNGTIYQMLTTPEGLQIIRY